MDEFFRDLRYEADEYYHEAVRKIDRFRHTGGIEGKIKDKIKKSYDEAKDLIETASENNDVSEETRVKIAKANVKPLVVASYERFYLMERGREEKT